MALPETRVGHPEGPMIQFIHANAYTPECYHKMLSQIPGYDIHLPELRPLWQAAPATGQHSWDHLIDDVIQHMEDDGRTNVIGIGHSLGGIISWLAAIRRPDLFERLILIDPVVLPKRIIFGTKALPMSIKKRYVPIVKIASRRKDQWKNRSEAKEFLLSKKIFQRFDSDVLDTFIQHGLKPSESGVTLRFPKLWESWVYAHPPNMWHKLKQAPCPITILRAEDSDVLYDTTWKKIQKNMPHAHLINVPEAGHLFPFDAPIACGELVRRCLK